MDDRPAVPSTGTVARGEAIVTVLAVAGAATAAVAGARTETNEAAVSDEAAAAVVEAAEALAATGEVMELDGERALTPLQREVITELQKILLTLNQINELLLKAIRKKETVEDAQKSAVESVRRVFGGVGGDGSQ